MSAVPRHAHDDHPGRLYFRFARSSNMMIDEARLGNSDSSLYFEAANHEEITMFNINGRLDDFDPTSLYPSAHGTARWRVALWPKDC